MPVPTTNETMALSSIDSLRRTVICLLLGLTMAVGCTIKTEIRPPDAGGRVDAGIDAGLDDAGPSLPDPTVDTLSLIHI